MPASARLFLGTSFYALWTLFLVKTMQCLGVILSHDSDTAEFVRSGANFLWYLAQISPLLCKCWHWRQICTANFKTCTDFLGHRVHLHFIMDLQQILLIWTWAYCPIYICINSDWNRNCSGAQYWRCALGSCRRQKVFNQCLLSSIPKNFYTCLVRTAFN